MRNWGIVLLVWGCIGVGLGHMMFGDIGVACTYAAITSLVVGISFVKTDKLNA